MWTAVRTLLKMGPVGPKHGEIRQYTNKIVTSVGFHSIRWKDVRYKKLKIYLLRLRIKTDLSLYTPWNWRTGAAIILNFELYIEVSVLEEGTSSTDWKGTQSRQNALKKRKVFCPCRESKHSSLIAQPVACDFTESIIAVPVYRGIK